MKKGWSEVPLTDIAKLTRRKVLVEADGLYPEVGVRCFGKGLFHKLPRPGLEVGDKKLFALQSGDFILQVTFAWEGAVAIVGKEDESLFGSVRVLTFEIDDGRCDRRFLLWYFRTRAGVEQLARISPGSAGRNRVLAVGKLGEVRISLPPLAEQQRIVAHLDVVEARLSQVQKLREDAATESLGLLRSLMNEEHCKDVRFVPMGELVNWRSPDTVVVQTESYRFAGVYSFGRGVFRKEEKAGTEFAYDRLTRLRAREFTYPKLMAWEGALGVVPEDCDGCHVSPEFPVFTVDESKVLPEVLDIHFKSPSVWKKLADISTGTNLRRRRLNPNAFLGYLFPLPPMEVQQHVKRIADLAATRRAEQKKAADLEAALLPSLLDRVFNT